MSLYIRTLVLFEPLLRVLGLRVEGWIPAVIYHDLPFDTLVQYSFRSPGGKGKGGKFDATGHEIRDI